MDWYIWVIVLAASFKALDYGLKPVFQTGIVVLCIEVQSAVLLWNHLQVGLTDVLLYPWAETRWINFHVFETTSLYIWLCLQGALTFQVNSKRKFMARFTHYIPVLFLVWWHQHQIDCVLGACLIAFHLCNAVEAGLDIFKLDSNYSLVIELIYKVVFYAVAFWRRSWLYTVLFVGPVLFVLKQ